MIRKSAKVTISHETRAHVVENGCRRGLNIGHLRAFVEQANIAGLPDDVPVYLTDKLQSRQRTTMSRSRRASASPVPTMS